MRITESHVYDAHDETEQSQIEHGMRELTQHGHLALVATLQLALEKETPARVREIYPCCWTIAGRSKINPLVRQQIHDHLADLAMLDILDRQSHNEGRRGGQYYEYEFGVDRRTVREVVRELEGLALPQRVRHRL